MLLYFNYLINSSTAEVDIFSLTFLKISRVNNFRMKNLHRSSIYILLTLIIITSSNANVQEDLF
jgi:hypothetical protein